MTTSIVMPRIGYDMTEGSVVRWLKHASETVHKGAVIAGIETDKVTIEMEPTADGVTHEPHAPGRPPGRRWSYGGALPRRGARAPGTSDPMAIIS